MNFWPQLAPKIIGAKSLKNMDWPKPKKHGVAKAQKTWSGQSPKNNRWPHHEGRPSAAPHHMVAGAEGVRHHVVIHDVATYCFWALATPFLLALANPYFLNFWPLLF